MRYGARIADARLLGQPHRFQSLALTRQLGEAGASRALGFPSWSLVIRDERAARIQSREPSVLARMGHLNATTRPPSPKPFGEGNADARRPATALPPSRSQAPAWECPCPAKLCFANPPRRAQTSARRSWNFAGIGINEWEGERPREPQRTRGAPAREDARPPGSTAPKPHERVSAPHLSYPSGNLAIGEDKGIFRKLRQSVVKIGLPFS